jgi:hypothetical protein
MSHQSRVLLHALAFEKRSLRGALHKSGRIATEQTTAISNQIWARFRIRAGRRGAQPLRRDRFVGT